MTRTRPTAPALVTAIIIAITAGILAALHFHTANAAPSFQSAPTPQATASTGMGSFNPAAIYQRVSGGVVTIEAVVGDETIGGSGFVADSAGHIITASHVVYDYDRGLRATSVYVDFASGDRVVATVVGLDQFSDIAVLKVDPSEVTLHPLQFDDSDQVIPGQPVLAIGAPFGNDGSISQGIVSAVHRTPPSLINSNSLIPDAIQTDTPINHGNSGGPLFDASGRVIGINQQIKSANGESDGVAFADSSQTVMRSFRQILASGTVSYAHLGLVTTTVTPQLAAAESLPASHGVVVKQATGPALRAGISAGTQVVDFEGDTIQLGDEIIAINGQAVMTSDDVTQIASRLNVGQHVQVVLYHNGKRQIVTVTPDARAL